MLHESVFREIRYTYPIRKADTALLLTPVATVAPVAAFTGMTKARPAHQLVKAHIVQAVEAAFRDGVLLVSAPTLNDRVERVDEGGL